MYVRYLTYGLLLLFLRKLIANWQSANTFARCGNPCPPTPLIFSMLYTIYTSTFSNHQNVVKRINDVIFSAQLVYVLQDQATAPWGIYVYRPQRVPVAERVRDVFDFLAQKLA